ncbi:hypothetical protein N7495_002391 [Penicillium taxi]|uniref:uncharacterized protein n=1 Tax=Penicillium taxi TaxID=168475 RepID=UPI0025455B58|nr:uncharacterized protein N7495_002391 [Penicillium taxi]KAJ5901863.1 hypothetical protein N7495_002391 [Penicillium taxi]
MMDWRKNLGFLDRLKTIQSLTTAHQQSSSAAAFKEAQAQAKQYENEAHSQATSKEEYDEMCQQAIDAAETNTSAISVICDDPPEIQAQDDSQGSATSSPSSIGETIGEDGSLHAVKVTVPHLMGAPHDTHREVRLLHEASNTHVIRLIETFKLDEGRFVLVFPFVQYDFEHLLRRNMVTAAQTRSALLGLFSGLAHIHKLGIIHRDIKPSNILMDSPDGPAYLADFGISWKQGDPGSEPSDLKITDVGTTCYRAPEILFGYKAYGLALDIWAAGCVVAEAIAADHRTLFDSGPLGSDLSLIHSIFSKLGTPNEKSWPDVHVLPDWGKVTFESFPNQSWDEILPSTSTKGRDLVQQLICYESRQRLSAEEALRHPFFSKP